MKTIAVISASLMLSACATIVGTPTQTVPISSTPSDAKVLVTDEAGMQVFAGQTPTSVTLNKSTGKYWGKKNFTVTISKEGYTTQNIPITSSANAWYIGGNLIFGGLIGWFIVDPLNGHMYTLSPDAINTSISKDAAAHNNQATDGSIAIMLIEDVPAHLRNKLVRLY